MAAGSRFVVVIERVGAAGGSFDTGDAGDVLGAALALPVRDHRPHLALGHPRSLDAARHRRRGRQQQHVALADQALRSGLVEDDPAVGQRRHREGQPRRDVRLDHARDHVHRRTLCGQHQMDAHGSGHLCDAAHRLLDVACRHHHEVVELVHHDEDERQSLPVHGRCHRGARFGDAGGHPLGDVVFEVAGLLVLEVLLQVVVDGAGFVELSPFDRGVVPGDVPHARLGQHVVAALHLGDGPRQGVGGLLGVDDHLGQQVREAVVLAELHPFGVDEDEAELFGCGPHHDRGDQRVDARRLSGAGGAGDQDVGHVGEVLDHGPSRDVTAEGHFEGVGGLARLLGGEDVAQCDELTQPVGDLDADGRLARDRGQDPHVG